MTEIPAHPLPSYLVQRYRGWRAVYYEEARGWFQRLAEDGQRPRAMVIGCCDSRVEPTQLFAAEPGELFIMRNIANLAPPYAPDDQRHGTSAAIEYAVKSLKVAHLIILGHAGCGGVAAYHDFRTGKREDSSDFIGRWLDTLAPAFARIEGMEGERAARVRALEQEGVAESLRNLLSFPYVAEAAAQGLLRLHGLWFDIAEGTLHQYDGAEARFRRV